MKLTAEEHSQKKKTGSAATTRTLVCSSTTKGSNRCAAMAMAEGQTEAASPLKGRAALRVAQHSCGQARLCLAWPQAPNSSKKRLKKTRGQFLLAKTGHPHGDELQTCDHF